MSDFINYAIFITTDAHRENFINGNLVESWSRMYPFIFDDQDKKIALNQRNLGYHYYEWFAAILLFHTKGYLSLVESYAYKSHTRKRRILETLVTGDALKFIASRGISSVTQCPDLLLYKPDKSEWFFCEVKGPKDKLKKKQIDFFKELRSATGKNISVVKFINQ